MIRAGFDLNRAVESWFEYLYCFTHGAPPQFLVYLVNKAGLNHLKEVSIIFHDPVLAVQHIENVWSNPDEWWNSEQVIQARKHFDTVCGKVSSDAMTQWTNFFKLNV